MTSPPALADIDGDGDIDGVLRRIKDGTGLTMTLSQNILTIGTSGGVHHWTDGSPSGVGENGDIAIDYTNGDVYRMAGGSWSILETIPSIARLRMFTGTYVTSNFGAGKFGLYDEKYYFYKTLLPGCSTVANAETYFDNHGFRPGTRLIFQQIDNRDNVAVFRATSGTIYTTGDAGYESTPGIENVAIEMAKEYGVNLTADAKYHVYITMPVNFLFDTSGNATISADLTIKEFILTTGEGTTASTSITTIDEWAIATYRSAKYEYQITNTGASPDEYQTGEMMVLHDGTNSKHNDYGVIFTGSSPLGTFSTDVSSGNCRLRFTATNSDAITVKVARKAIKV